MARDEETRDLAAAPLSSAQCRPSAFAWFSIVFTAGVGIVPAVLFLILAPTGPHPPSPADMLGLQCLAAILYIPSLAFLPWMLRARMIADEQGLRWRGLHAWRFAAWDQVSDYYNSSLPGRHSSSGKYTSFVIETPVGRLKFGDHNWTNVDSLRRVVEANAKQARAMSVENLGERGEIDLPATFDFQDFNNRSIPWILGGCGVAFAGLFVGNLIALFRVYSQSGLNSSAGDRALQMLFMLALQGTFMALMAFTHRGFRRRMDQCITASTDGLMFQDGQDSLFMTWDEVTDYSIKPDPNSRFLQVPVHEVTGAGRSFYFTHSLRDAAVLEAIISTHATNSATKEWRRKTNEILGGANACWSGVREGVGDRIFHYQTRSNRAVMVLAPLSLLSTLPIVVMVSNWLRDVPVVDSFGLFFIAIGACIAWWTWRIYRYSYVRVSEAGLESKTPFRTIFIPWEEVREYTRDLRSSDEAGIVIGSRDRIRFGALIADIDDLKDEIARRAVNSSSKSWDAKKAVQQP